MRRLRFGVAVVLIGALAAFASGCGESDPDEANTPANAPTITNGQPPAEGGEGGEGEGGEGDIAAGKTAFEGACQNCHTAGGTQAGAGPVLADRGLATEAIRNQIVNGGGAMPANLVEGADLDNVTAFVASLQGESAPAAPAGGGEGGDDAAVAAGKTFFEGTCQGCHTDGGTTAGAGPILAKKGLTEDGVRNQIVNGGAGMPPNLASGDDLENVTKFVLSLQ
jgi:cytochrome c551